MELAKILDIYQNVGQVVHHKNIKLVTQDLINMIFIHFYNIEKPKIHYQIFEIAIQSSEKHFSTHCFLKVLSINKHISNSAG